MPLRHLLVLCVLLTLLATPARALAWEPTRYTGRLFHKEAPEPRLRPQYVDGYNPYASRLHTAVPTFNWGHFGARSHPTCEWHTGYSGRYFQWRFYPGSPSHH